MHTDQSRIEAGSQPYPALRRQSRQVRRRDGWDLFLIIAGSAGLALGLLTAAALAAFSLFGEDSVTLGIQAASFAALGLLGTPAIYWGALGLRDRAVRRPPPLWMLAIFLYPLSLAIGVLAFETGTLPRVLGPLAHIVAAATPVVFVVSVSLARGPIFSARRRWAHFLAGLWATPPLSLLLELIALLPAGLLMIFGLMLSAEGQPIFEDMLALDITSEPELLQLAERLVAQPIVVIIGVSLLAGVVPLIEELLKTLTIWPLLSRPMTASQAFLGGALGGAGYALFESMFLPQAGEAWVLTMVARAGTPLIHAFNTGLVCWGLAEGVRRGRWLFLGATYVLAVGLHGMWNLAAVGIGLSGFGTEGFLEPLLAGPVGYLGVLGLLGLTGVSLAGLIWLPARLGED